MMFRCSAKTPQQASTTTDGKSPVPDAPTTKINPANPSNPDDQYGKQPKRILWVIPNYRAVSANTHLPPLSFKKKFWLATEDTFDYSDFIFVAGLAGISMANKSQPSFGQGAAGYGRYYWHLFVDGGIENYMTEAIVPAVTKEDPRYYTLGKGGFIKRTGYAVSRLLITKTDLSLVPDGLVQRLASLNTMAPIVDAGDADANAILFGGSPKALPRPRPMQVNSPPQLTGNCPVGSRQRPRPLAKHRLSPARLFSSESGHSCAGKGSDAE